MMRFKKFFGPIRYYRLKNGGISAFLKGYEDSSFGWELGYDVFDDQPIVAFHLLGLRVFVLERYRGGSYFFALLGFWVFW